MNHQLLFRVSTVQHHLRYFPALIPSTNLKAVLWMQSATGQICDNYQTRLSYNLVRKLNTSNNCLKEVSLSDKVKHELSIFKSVDLSQLKCAPFPAIVYGFGGVIPFLFPPLYFLVGSYSSFLATSQLMYGASILAFIGGVKWGSAVAKGDISHEQIGWSTVPSLVAWLSLLVPEPIGFLMVSSGLVGALYMDLVSSKYPPWFFALRYSLTGVAVTSLTISFVCYLLH